MTYSPPRPPAGDDLDRLFHRLVAVVADSDRARLDGPFQVRELFDALIPYRTQRRALGIDSRQDYEMALVRLLAGEKGYARLDPPDAQAALALESRNKNPDTGAYLRFATASLTLNPNRVREVLDPFAAYRAPPAEPQAAPASLKESDVLESPAAFEVPETSEVPFALDLAEERLPTDEPGGAEGHLARAGAAAGTASCAFCGGQLPIGRTVVYCPHCGQNVGVVHCPTCASQLEIGWKFCISCGRTLRDLA